MTTLTRFLRLLPIGSLLFTLAYCAEKPESKPAVQAAPSALKPAQKSLVRHLDGVDALNRVVENSGDTLLIFDLYADWCMPCRMISPILEQIAADFRDRAVVYKINTDKNQQIAQALRVQGIPYVLYVKNKEAVQAFTGVQPKETYIRAIDTYTAKKPAAAAAAQDRPDGDLVNGERVIKLTTMTTPGNLYVYRGETVKIVVEKVDIPYSISIPGFNAAAEANPGKDLVITFKAETVGVFPMFCNGQCPAGDGSRFGQITVMQYEGGAGSDFTELTAQEASRFIAEKKPFILDVRTPNEFYSGYIEGATLLPLQQLQQRVSELNKHKDREILVYCRTGNRSTVAAEILHRAGFTKLYNLRPGIVGWQKENLPVVKSAPSTPM